MRYSDLSQINLPEIVINYIKSLWFVLITLYNQDNQTMEIVKVQTYTQKTENKYTWNFTEEDQDWKYWIGHKETSWSKSECRHYTSGNYAQK